MILQKLSDTSAHLGAVGGCEQQHARAALKAVQLRQQLIQRLVPLLIRAQTSPPTCQWNASTWVLPKVAYAALQRKPHRRSSTHHHDCMTNAPAKCIKKSVPHSSTQSTASQITQPLLAPS